MTGKLGSNLPEPLFLLDESLAPPVASALSLVGYRFHDVRETIAKQGVKDPEIIAWCQEHEAVWVHADDLSKSSHKLIEL